MRQRKSFRFFSSNGRYATLIIITLFIGILSACTKQSTTQTLKTFTSPELGKHVGNKLSVKTGETWFAGEDYRNFKLTGEALTSPDAEASLRFHTDGQSGYEITFRNGAIDGTRKTGSLAAVRNLYRSLAEDGKWFRFEVAVRGKNITVAINDTTVVCYTEPDQPYRTEMYANRLLSHGQLAFCGIQGEVTFRDLRVTRLNDKARNKYDTLPPVDEQNDAVIRLQQQNFPVIDYHVHLKGGLTKEMAQAMSMNYGIQYGVAPNAGEGGVGRMLANDKEVY